MKISIIGSGYVGLVTATCLADTGMQVMCVDVDAKKIENLRSGIIPIYEPGLEEMVRRNMQAGRLVFTTDVELAAKHGSVHFICVGTPPSPDGSADLSFVYAAAENIARYIDDYVVVVNKSTVPVGTADAVHLKIHQVLSERGVNIDFDVVSNPEFLKEGAAIEDFMRPDRVVIGTSSDRAFALMSEIYGAFAFKTGKILRMDAKSAEMTKYAANAMLATRISFMNSLSGLADATGANIDDIRKGMGLDSRIGPSFLYAGCGYGGSCFPKDVRALAETAKQFNIELPILDAVEAINNRQKSVISEKIVNFFAEITGKKFAIWGLAFKPKTDDMREAPSETIIRKLLSLGAIVVCYDPIAKNQAMEIYKDIENISFVDNALECLSGVDALVIPTEHKEFRSPDWVSMKERMNCPIIFDGRNMYDTGIPRKNGFQYFSIGRP